MNTISRLAISAALAAAMFSLPLHGAGKERQRRGLTVMEYATEKEPAYGLFIDKINRQRSFSKTLPGGNYSGMTHLSRDLYALVDDKSEADGFRMVRVRFNRHSGNITRMDDLGFRSSGLTNSDGEGIALNSTTGTIFMSREADNSILEYDLGAKPTGRAVPTGDIFPYNGNLGLESLCCDKQGNIWTTTESALSGDVHRIQRFNPELEIDGYWQYRMDNPLGASGSGIYVYGISELLMLDNGRLLVLEREANVPEGGLGAYVINKIYVTMPSSAAEGELLEKQLLVSFRTGIDLIDRSFANYEGLCLGPELSDGSYPLILVADSQNQYLGILNDWFMCIRLGGM